MNEPDFSALAALIASEREGRCGPIHWEPNGGIIDISHGESRQSIGWVSRGSSPAAVADLLLRTHRANHLTIMGLQARNETLAEAAIAATREAAAR